MKARLCLLAAVFAVGLARAEMRTWTFEKTGRTIEAEAAGFLDDSVTLKEASGKVVAVPISYLSKGDRLYLSGEQARQWKEVEVVSLDASSNVGRYKKCKVKAAGVGSEVYIDRLPASVIAVLQARHRQAAPMEELSKEVDANKQAVQEAKAGVPSKGVKGRGQRRAAARQRGQVNAQASNVNAMEVELARLRKAYDDSVEKTKQQTTVKMRNTGVIYKGLPLWQCLEPVKPQR